jgi:hypothetical protein
MKAPIRIGLQPGAKSLYIERFPRRVTKWGYWLIPQNTNHDRTLGIFLKLYDTGRVERVTVRDDRADEVVLIKPEDGK